MIEEGVQERTQNSEFRSQNKSEALISGSAYLHSARTAYPPHFEFPPELLQLLNS
jgi:hypothetical protein